MQLVPSRPTTIHAVHCAQRWFPALYRHTDGSLLMYIENGYDANFAPFGKWSSSDGGKTWREEEENVPRCQIVHSFADGTLFEIDGHGFLDPKTTGTYHVYGAWSTPGATGSHGHSAFYHGAKDRGEDWLGRKENGVLRDTFSMESPSLAPTPLTLMHHGYPHHPWWPLINRLHSPEVADKDVMLGTSITDTEEFDGSLLAVSYWVHRDDEYSQRVFSVFCYRSDDRGHTWREIAQIARGTKDHPEGFNEATLTLLNDGRLYSVLRSGSELYHSWSEDGGCTWSTPTLLRLIDSDSQPGMAWPRVAKLEDGTLVLAYGRPGKQLVFDPTGTGEAWQGHLDLHEWELRAQAENGVPENQRLRGDTASGVRYWDSGDYLSVVPIGPREMLVTYDVQNYIEHANDIPVAGVRMVRVELTD